MEILFVQYYFKYTMLQISLIIDDHLQYNRMHFNQLKISMEGLHAMCTEAIIFTTNYVCNNVHNVITTMFLQCVTMCFG